MINGSQAQRKTEPFGALKLVCCVDSKKGANGLRGTRETVSRARAGLPSLAASDLAANLTDRALDSAGQRSSKELVRKGSAKSRSVTSRRTLRAMNASLAVADHPRGDALLIARRDSWIPFEKRCSEAVGGEDQLGSQSRVGHETDPQDSTWTPAI